MSAPVFPAPPQRSVGPQTEPSEPLVNSSDSSSSLPNQMDKTPAQISRINEVLEGEADKQLKVRSILIQGASKTQQALFLTVLNPLLNAASFHEIVDEVGKGANRLNRLGLFKSVVPTIDAAPNDPKSVDVIYNINEGPTYALKTGAEFTAHDTTTSISGKLMNFFGFGEVFETKLAYDVEPDSSINNRESLIRQGGPSFYLNISKPLIRKPKFGSSENEDEISSISFNQYRRNRELLDVIPHNRKETGTTVSYRNVIPRLNLENITAFDFCWRQINASETGGYLPWSIRKDLGHSIISTVSNTLTIDNLDDKIIPTTGWMARIQNELAGFGIAPSILGNSNHIKSELTLQSARYLGYGFSLLATSKIAGLFGSINKSNSSLNIPFYDRFSLGGPSSIRGFKPAGVGPVDDNIHIGGNAYWTTGLSLFTPLPYLIDKPLKGHLFVNAGNLSLLGVKENRHKENGNNILSRILEPTNISAGFGLACKFSILRLELNCCIPLRWSASDRLQPGYQFGAGIEFL